MAANRQYVRLPLAATTKTTSNKKQNGYKEKENKNKQCELDAYTVKPVFNGTWIKRKPVLNEQILWSREYSTKIHIK
jgi:hypothetical protein